MLKMSRLLDPSSGVSLPQGLLLAASNLLLTPIDDDLTPEQLDALRAQSLEGLEDGLAKRLAEALQAPTVEDALELESDWRLLLDAAVLKLNSASVVGSMTIALCFKADLLLASMPDLDAVDRSLLHETMTYQASTWLNG